MYIFCPITKTLNAEKSRPFLIPHEFIQPVEIPTLEIIHNTKYNHKLYNLIQNTPYEFAVGTEELKPIKALQMVWPLLQTKNIIRILAKLLTKDYNGYFKDIKDYINLNGEKYRPQDISAINIYSFVTLKNEIIAFLGWPYYIPEKLTILYAMFNFIGFLFSLLKGIYNTCAIHTQVNRQASVARILFAGSFGIFSSSINKILLDAQIKEYNTKIATRQNTYDEEHNNIEITPTAPQLPPLTHNPPLSPVPQNLRNLAITNNSNFRPNISLSPIHNIITHHSQNDNTYQQIIEQPHTTTFQSQHNHFFSPR